MPRWRAEPKARLPGPARKLDFARGRARSPKWVVKREPEISGSRPFCGRNGNDAPPARPVRMPPQPAPRRARGCKGWSAPLSLGFFGGLGRFVGGADFGDEFIRVLVEFFFTVRAAQFHFLPLVNKHIRLAHVAAQFVAGDGTGRQFIRHGFGGGRFGICGADGQAGNRHEGQNQKDFLHNVQFDGSITQDVQFANGFVAGPPLWL